MGMVVGNLFYGSRSRIRFLHVGQLVVKLLLIKFASHKRIDDGLWRLGTLVETRYGQLNENETITIQAKRFTATITRTPDRRVALIKKVTTE